MSAEAEWVAYIPAITGIHFVQYWPGIEYRAFTRLSQRCDRKATTIMSRVHMTTCEHALLPCEATAAPEVIEDE